MSTTPDNKFLVLEAKKFFLKLFVYDFVFVFFQTALIDNFHNARGHYGEISQRQQPITARDFTIF